MNAPTNFQQPDALWLLVPIGLLAVGYVITQLKRPRFTMKFGNLGLLERAIPRRRSPLRHVPALLMIAALGGLAVAVAEPTTVTTTTEDRARVVLAIDVSPSMLADDVAPSRLIAAQEAARDLIGGLPASFELGIVQFAGEADLLVPPTTDRVAALAAIDSLEVASETGIGEAVDTSLGTLLRTTTDDIPGAIVIMSDGKSTAGREVGEAAQEAAASGVAVSTIAFGTAAGEIELGGQVQAVPVDGTSLEELAGLTDGQHYTAADGSELAEAYQKIIEPLKIEIESAESNAAFFVLAGLITLLLAGGTALVLEERLP